MHLFKPSWDCAEKVQAVLLHAGILGSLFSIGNEANNHRYCAVGHVPSAYELRWMNTNQTPHDIQARGQREPP